MILPLDNNIESGADFSICRNYRYRLWRIWDKSKPLVMFIGLNPSKADENDNDNTMDRVCSIAKNNGYGGVYMVNCFAYIATNPDELKHNPMSDEWNNNVITMTAALCKDVVFAWGNFTILKKTGRDKELISMFSNPKAVFINKNGSPKHPLYCKSNTILIDYKL